MAYWQRLAVTTRCVPQLTRSVHSRPLYEGSQSSLEPPPRPVPGLGLATPRQLVEYLDQFIVGQKTAKKVLSVAVYNHYNRIKAHHISFEAQYGRESESLREEVIDETGVQPAKIRPLRHPASSPLLLPPNTATFEKSNVLVMLRHVFFFQITTVRYSNVCPGKTLLAKTLAKVLDVPFAVSDATSFTQAGYVGDDVEMAIQRLLQDANWDPARASMGIVYIDEVDKLARKSGSGMESSRDVSGEGVQQALLRMMEGAVITIQAKGGAAAEPVPPPGGQGHSRSGQRAPSVAPAAKSDVYNIDTSNVLFIVSGAFVGLENIIRQRVSKAAIGFSSTSVSDSLPFFTSNRKATQNVLDLVETSGLCLLQHFLTIETDDVGTVPDLVRYGFIPEFVSRLPTVTTLAPLTISDLRRILTDVKGSLVHQYKSLFDYSGVEIRFTSAALDEICQKAAEKEVGARGLRGIMESLLLEPMYEVPGSDIGFVLITEDVVRGDAPPSYWKKEQGAFPFWQAWAKEEGKYEKRMAK
ncbi:hypothetical protein D9758_001302 [Tetrapyrgos nigripes]|uniref:Clp ATPase C-terminal domain-containing protein n=1 Tax=Tetrapyrgos nigripes TaxID=182062 RepID=A0A8H5GS95_9AGAR|nr:hypothetical protein D9758_001302 [Tetrapyrgos nigripes]